ncbi:MAG: HEAT repeat domain-containing protein, partial [Nitrososphaera sp.]|nr:HEAT repeat domain-containing protein [Nitrososphaera sp.]
HQGYAEFLAAHYLGDQCIQKDSVIEMVFHPDGGLIPQLEQVVAWLAILRDEVWSAILDADPKTILQSDLTTRTENERADTVRAYLDRLKQYSDLDQFEIRQNYRKLKHNCLGDQLRPYIENKSNNVIVRRAAIDIAEACEERCLESILVSLALDESEDIHIRSQAVSALRSCGSPRSLKKLLPLVKESISEDVRDDLKGELLRLLWPDYISTPDVLRLITPPKRSNYYGFYSHFLNEELPNGLKVVDLPNALKHLAQTYRSSEYTGRKFDRLADKILLRAAHYLQQQNIAQAFADLAYARLERDHDLFDSPTGSESKEFTQIMDADPGKRRTLLEALLLRLHSKEDIYVVLSGGFFRTDDVEWMVDYLLSLNPYDKNAPSADALAELISRYLNRSDDAQFELLYCASKKSPAMRNELKWLLEPIELDSETARKLKKHHELNLKWRKESEERESPLVPSPKECALEALKQFESGDLDSWWRMDFWLSCSERGQYNSSNLDIASYPGWGLASQVERARIISAAESYLRNAAPMARPVSRLLTRANLSGYRAFALLAREARDRLLALESEIWEKWTTILVASFDYEDETHRKIQQILIELAYIHSPQAVVQAVEKLIRHEKRTAPESNLHLLDKLKRCWEKTDLPELLRKELLTRRLSDKHFREILDHLLEHEDKQSLECALRLFRRSVPADGKVRNRVIQAALSILTYAIKQGWDLIWVSIDNDESFGQELFLAGALDTKIRQQMLALLPENELGALYTWLSRVFPRNEDPKWDGEEARFVTPRDEIAEFRDLIPRQLVQKGTRAGVLALRRCAAAFPNLSQLRFDIIAAEKEMRRRTWEPLSPNQILALKRVQGAILIQQPSDLINVILKELQQYQAVISEKPARTAAQLWNKQSDCTWRPVEENDVSDHIQEFLQQRLSASGIVVNREVQISRKPGSGVGNRTDIQIDAIRHSNSGQILDVITVIVEVKGCWNHEIQTAPKSQLVDNYMKTSGAEEGIYVVGWFSQDRWDSTDYRRGNVPLWNLDEAQRNLDQITSDASETGRTARAFVLDYSF